MSTSETRPDSQADTSTRTDESGSSAQRERRRRILDATISLASEGGFDAVQMRAVADQAEVALGTLYRYFPSKIHLLVSALGRELEKTETALRGRDLPGETSADRVIGVLKAVSRGMQGDPHLTEALTRAFMFADASVRTEIEQVGMTMSAMLARAIHPERPAPEDLTDEEVALARVIGDVWLSALVGWVTGRSSAEDTGQQIEVAVRLLLR